MPAVTRTGGFPIGFRRGSSPWQSDLTALLAWARDSGFASVDLESDGPDAAAQVVASNVALGAVDLPEWGALMSPDPEVRHKAVDRDAAYVAACADVAGPLNHFLVLLPEDPQRPRPENFGYAVDSLNALAPTLEAHDARLVIEAYPGPGALACTPEGYRALFERCPSPAIGVNYDPSHFLRMGIDPVRFLREFVARVHHVHAKDTAVDVEGLYEFGHQQPPTFASTPPWGSTYWRYTIPGHGDMSWSEAFGVLAAAGYAGRVSVELEDADYNGATDTEQEGLLLSRAFLESC
jgi:sugar phosphate isomerase/epimerase